MSAVLARVAAVTAAGRLPVAVLDVDLTLVDNAPRSRAIFCDWLASLRGRWPGAEAALARAQVLPIVFSAPANIAALGVDDPDLAREGLAFWWERFFSPRYACLDVPLPGAIAAARALHGAGCTLVYLTARPTSLGDATVTRFRELGLPIAEVGTALVMKDDPAERDSAFKARAVTWIGRLGEIVLCADNEPGHVNVMHAAFPDALAVLVDTRHSPGAPPLAPGAVVRPTLLDALG